MTRRPTLLVIAATQDGYDMPHALSAFIREQMDSRGMRNRDLEQRSGLSRQLVSKLVNDQRDVLTRLPTRDTLEGIARAFNTSVEVVLGKAVESLGLGFTSADFVYGVSEASNDELLAELRSRLRDTTEVGDPPRLATAARIGRSEGRRRRGAQDLDAQAPDPEGPEGGA